MKAKHEIVSKKTATTKARLQARYEKLLLDIQHNQDLRQTLQQGLRVAVPRIQKELRPLLDERDKLGRSRLLRLDELADELGLGKYDRVGFENYMASQASALMSRNGYGDEVLQALFEKYAGEPLALDKGDLANLAQQLKNRFGIDIDPRELLEKGVGTYMREHEGAIQKRRHEKREADEAEDLKNFDPSEKLAVNKQQQALLQDARAIYLRLMKKHHPDREPDETARIQKTGLIQRVTKAYQEKDFLTLLKLQIEYLEPEEVDAETLAGDMLKRYNKILQKQLDEIKEEIELLKYSSLGLFEEFFDHHHVFSERKFRNFKKSLRQEIAMIQADLNDSRKWQNEWFKEWSKAIKAHYPNPVNL